VNVYRVLVSVERVNDAESDLECVGEGQAIAQFDSKQEAMDYARKIASDAQENGVGVVCE
jgi:hypothetical protein